MNTGNKIAELILSKRNAPMESKYQFEGAGERESETSEDDYKEITLTLSVEAVRKLIISYCKDIESFYEFWYYHNSVDSRGMSDNRIANQMLRAISNQLKVQGIDGEGLLEQIFVTHFKGDCNRMKLFSKNHESLLPDEPCDDPNCCKKTKSR